MHRFTWADWFNKAATWFNHSLRWMIYAILLLSVIVLVIRGSLTLLENNQQVIENRLSEVMNAPVKIEKFKAVWNVFEPELQITDLKIYHPLQANRVILRIPHINLELALWQSLINFKWRLDGSVTGLNINLTQDNTGEWAVAELLVLGESRPETKKIAVNWLLNQAKWSVNNSQFTLAPYQKPRIYLDKVHFKNHNFYQKHTFRVYGLINQQAFKVFADLKNTGDVLQEASWQGRVYAKLPRQAWHQWLPKTINDIEVKQAVLATETWLTVQAGRIQHITAQLDVDKLDVHHPQQEISANHLTALVSWQQDDKHTWHASVEHLQGQVNHQALEIEQLSLNQKKDVLSVAIKNADIKQGAELASTLTVTPQKIKTWLQQAKPSGKVSKLVAQLNLPQKKLITLSAQIKEFSALATSHMIGVNKMDLWLNHQNSKGYAGINIKQGQLDLKPIYRQATPVEQLSVLLKWSDLGDAWLIESNQLKLKNSDAQGEAVLSLWLPKADISAAQMQLLASIYQGNLASVWRYVPWPSAGDETLAWLKSALVSGNINRGDFLYQGVLIDNPQRPPSTMQMHFSVRDGVLDYEAQWPSLKRLNADIDIYNRRLTITAKNSQIYESVAREISAEISDLNEPKLRLKAGIDTTGEDLMRLFKETPLKEETAHFADMIGIKGEIAGELELQLPLASATQEKLSVDVLAELVGNPIVLRQAPEFDLWLSGGVSYKTGLGLTSLPLQGFLLTQPVSVKLQSVLNAGDIAAVQIQANGQLAPINLKPWLADLTQSMRGQTQYSTLLTIPMTNDPVHIVLDSNLLGWQIDLPEPFKKVADKSLPVHYEMELQSPHKQTGYLVVGSALQSGFEVKNGLISRMIVLLGENWAGELPPQGLWIQGHVDHMNIDEWLPWLRPVNKNKTPQNVASVMPKLQSFSVSFDDMAYLGYQLHDVRLGYESLSQASRFQITSNDLNGEVLWPFDAQQSVKLNIQSLNLPFAGSPIRATQKKVKPSTDWAIPTVDIKIKELSSKAWPRLETSQLRATLKPNSQGITLQRIVLKNPDFSMEGSLDWQWQGKESTRYLGKINVADVASLFSSFNKPATLNSQQAHANLALSWQGNPSELSLEKLNGELNVELDKGRILQLNRALNLSRILGVLDSDNIKRRLKFDFSDVTQKGLAYDAIVFDADIVNGEMHNTLLFKSPSAQAQAQGTVDLPSKTFNQSLQVSMPLASVVPYAAAIVAGPAIGGALVAAEALFDHSLTQMTTLYYDVNGSLSEPKMQRVKNPNLLWHKWRKPIPVKQPKLKKDK
ncbi:MAG: TIGR02099 family protein [Moraxellaceae bacterium]|nr:TIGR02099 family protein [Moraxellaceae bacterium]